MPRDGSGVYSPPPGSNEATPNTTILSSLHNALVNDLTADANAARPITAGGTGATSAGAALSALGGVSYATSQALTDAQKAQAIANIGAPFRGYLSGLTLSNNATDATNDIDIAIGEAASTDTPPAILTLASGITKRLDAAWAVGSGNGGLDTGSIANTTYHVWLIKRSDTGVVDALFSTSATAPTMPTNYDLKRRIGSIMRESGAIATFTQVGSMFRRGAASTDRNDTAATTSVLLALSVPAGIVVRPMLRLAVTIAGNRACSVNVGSAQFGNVDITALVANTGTGDDFDTVSAILPPYITTNTSRQIYFSQSNTTGAPNASTVQTLGWMDARGMEG